VPSSSHDLKRRKSNIQPLSWFWWTIPVIHEAGVCPIFSAFGGEHVTHRIVDGRQDVGVDSGATAHEHRSPVGGGDSFGQADSVRQSTDHRQQRNAQPGPHRGVKPCQIRAFGGDGVGNCEFVSMLFCVIPAVAGLLSWVMLGQRLDIGIGAGLVLGAVACWLNARASGKQRQDDPRRDGRGQQRFEAAHQATVTSVAACSRP
jgi:hypothetical protein